VIERSYFKEKMAVTIEILATGTEPLPARLLRAHSLGVGRLLPDSVATPKESDLLDRIKVAMTKLSAPKRGSAVATAAAMDDRTAQGIARDCLELYCRAFGIWPEVV
jgi:hypothetical protein